MRDFPQQPYQSTRQTRAVDRLVDLFAAAYTNFPDQLERKNAKGTTIKKLLQDMCVPMNLSIS